MLSNKRHAVHVLFLTNVVFILLQGCFHLFRGVQVHIHISWRISALCWEKYLKNSKALSFNKTITYLFDFHCHSFRFGLLPASEGSWTLEFVAVIKNKSESAKCAELYQIKMVSFKASRPFVITSFTLNGTPRNFTVNAVAGSGCRKTCQMWNACEEETQYHKLNCY